MTSILDFSDWPAPAWLPLAAAAAASTECISFHFCSIDCALLPTCCCVLVCSDVITAPGNTTPKAAAELLQQNKKGKLPLVNAQGQLVSGPGLSGLSNQLTSCHLTHVLPTTCCLTRCHVRHVYALSSSFKCSTLLKSSQSDRCLSAACRLV